MESNLMPYSKLHELMTQKGFTPLFDRRDEAAGRTTPENPPMFAIHFVKETKHIWKTDKYILSELIDGHYHNHKKFNSIFELIHNI